MSASKRVCHGDVLRLTHVITKRVLHSHDAKFGHVNSSKQQVVACCSSRDELDNWMIELKSGEAKDGQPIPNCSVVRLTHCATRLKLHSHQNPAPVTAPQHEVTCYGGADANDDWRVELEVGEGEDFVYGAKFSLIHLMTKHSLHSHGANIPGLNLQEVTCYAARDDNDIWVGEYVGGRYYQVPRLIERMKQPFMLYTSHYDAVAFVSADVMNGDNVVEVHGKRDDPRNQFVLIEVSPVRFRIHNVVANKDIFVSGDTMRGDHVVEAHMNVEDRNLFEIRVGDPVRGTFSLFNPSSGKVVFPSDDVMGGDHVVEARGGDPGERSVFQALGINGLPFAWW